MFYDADAHWHPPVEIFADFPESFRRRVNDNTTRVDLDLVWKSFYDIVKDASWPEPGKITDFHKLPEFIRKELKELHCKEINDFRPIYISDDLEYLHVDYLYNHYPDTETQRKSLLHFVKACKQVLNPPVRIFRMTYTEDPRLAVELMKTYNRVLLDVCDSTPEFDGTLWLALQDVPASLEELNRYLDRDIFGVFLSEKPPLPFIKDLYPLFETCAKNKIPLYVHFQDDEDPPLHWQIDYDNPSYQQLKNHFHFLGNTWPITILGFITSGVLDRFPDLRIAFVEKSMSDVAEARQGLIDMGYDDPLPYFRRNFWFTIDIEESGAVEIAQEIGWDRIMYGSDYPHNNACGGKNRYHDVDMFDDLLSRGVLSQDEYDWVSHKNYLRLKERW